MKKALLKVLGVSTVVKTLHDGDSHLSRLQRGLPVQLRVPTQSPEVGVGRAVNLSKAAAAVNESRECDDFGDG